jgi:hypothetical protein
MPFPETNADILTFHDTIGIYQDTRDAACMSCMRDYADKYPNLILTNITLEALREFRGTWKAEFRHPSTSHWDWEKLQSDRHSNPKRFELAIWSKTLTEDGISLDLHGMAIGRTSRSRSIVRVEYLESYPFDNHPFPKAIFPIVERTLTYYAILVEASRLELVNPAPALVKHYERRGFQLERVHGRDQVMFKELERSEI